MYFIWLLLCHPNGIQALMLWLSVGCCRILCIHVVFTFYPRKHDYPEIDDVGICHPICFLDFIGKFLQSSQKVAS